MSDAVTDQAVKASFPVMGKLRLISIKTETNLPQGKTKLIFQVEKMVRVGLLDVLDDSRCVPNVAVNFKAKAWPDGLPEQGGSRLSAEAAYEVNFSPFAKGISRKDAMKLVGAEALAPLLLIQAYPLAFAHFLSQLNLMGAQMGTVALGVDQPLLDSHANQTLQEQTAAVAPTSPKKRVRKK